MTHTLPPTGDTPEPETTTPTGDAPAPSPSPTGESERCTCVPRFPLMCPVHGFVGMRQDFRPNEAVPLPGIKTLPVDAGCRCAELRRDAELNGTTAPTPPTLCPLHGVRWTLEIPASMVPGFVPFEPSFPPEQSGRGKAGPPDPKVVRGELREDLGRSGATAAAGPVVELHRPDGVIERYVGKQTAGGPVQVAEPCKVPPPGWSCSRPSGHEGPCAASPVPTTGDEDLNEPRTLGG